MAFNTNSQFRAELNRALEALELQIEALNYFNRFIPSTSAFLMGAKAKLNGRKLFIQNVLVDLDKLETDKDLLDKDGYPSADFSALLGPLFAELNSVVKNIRELEGLFKLISESLATKVDIIPGTPVDKK